MSDQFLKLKIMISELGLVIQEEAPDEEIIVISDEERGISNMIVDIEDPIVILEQHIFDVLNNAPVVFKRLLQMNRELVHGAFVLDETGTRVYFRDTLEIKTLDPVELESAINSLSLALAENAKELLSLAGN